MKSREFVPLLLLSVILLPNSMLFVTAGAGDVLLLPRLGTPTFSTPGGQIAMELTTTNSLSSANLLSGSKSAALEVVEAKSEGGKLVVKARIPGTAEAAMYDLELRLSDSSKLVEPHCVVVWEPKSEIKVVLTSDIHYSLRSTVEIQTLRTIIESMNALRPDLLIMTGDQVDYTRDESHHAAFRQELLSLEVPVVLAPGNNDLADNNVRLFDKFQGAHLGVVRMGWVDFYVMEADTGFVSDAGLAFLNSTARNSNATLKVALCHYPISSLAEDANRRQYLNSLKGAGISVAFSGHTHSNADQLVEGVRQIVLVSPSEPATGLARELRMATLSESLRGISETSMIPLGTPVNPIIPNSGIVPAGWANFSNPFSQPISLTYSFRIKGDGTTPAVEGATLVSTTTAEGVLLVRVALTLQARQSKEVKVYFTKDNSPPQLEFIGTDPADPKLGQTVVLRVRLVEQGWGLKGLSAKAKYQNDTTKYLRYTISGEELRVELPGDRTVREATVTVDATDWANLTGSTEIKVTIKTELFSPEGIMEIISNYAIVISVVVVVVIGAAYVLVRRK